MSYQQEIVEGYCILMRPVYFVCSIKTYALFACVNDGPSNHAFSSAVLALYTAQ